MEVLNPLMLWGVMGVSIPIAIHLWHQKKGKYHPWAATQWLSEKNLQQAKGFRFDEWLLLLLRCLAILLLAFYLSKPIWLNTSQASGGKQVHLLEPSAWVYENNKFEIKQALQKGEPCFWMTQPLTPVVADVPPPIIDTWSAHHFQAALNELSLSHDNSLQLYFSHSQALLTLPQIFVPTKYVLHPTNANQKGQGGYLQFADNQFVSLDESGTLLKQSQVPQGKKQIFTGTLAYYMPANHANEKPILAALQALSKVYGFSFKRVNQLSEATIAFETPPSQALTFVGHAVDYSEKMVALPESWQEMAFSEQLPVFLGEKIIKHLHLQTFDKPLSSKQIKALFLLQPYHAKQTQSLLTDVILIALLVIVGVERWLSLRQNS